jgi:hypothetical protein
MRRLGIPALAATVLSRLRDTTVVALSDDHNSLREGTTLGIVVATGIWVWLAVVDAIAGTPFETFAALGGIAVFTAVHYLLNIVYGVVIVSAVHGTSREPSLAVGLVFGLVAFEIALAMLTVLLSHLGRGALVLSRRHPLATQLRYADHRHDCA